MKITLRKVLLNNIKIRGIGMREYNLNYKIVTDICDEEIIAQHVYANFRGQTDLLNTWIIKTKEKQFIDALVKLGWTPPNKNKDYNLLYEKVCSGEHVLAFVDYKYPGDDEVYRDACKVYRCHGNIIVGARGIEYCGIYSWHLEKDSEINLFIRMCERLNIEWVD